MTASDVDTGVARDISTSHTLDTDDIPTGATCRICRGEATEDNPLYHPCKCKGSIKYIHEPCLFEWISSRNIDINVPGTTVNCDICHYPFQFKTTYDENTPDRIPVSILIANSAFLLLGKLQNILTISSVLFLIVIGLPFTWNAAGKIYTFLLDGGLPYSGDLLRSLIFGFSEDAPEVYTYKDILFPLLLNEQFSLWQIILVLVLHLALYFQYDMIVREDVFSKMVYHKIGPNLSAEELKERLKERFPMMDDEMLEHVAKAMAERERAVNEPQFINNNNNNINNNNGPRGINVNRVVEQPGGIGRVDINEHVPPLRDPIEAIRNDHARVQARLDNLLDEHVRALNEDQDRRPNVPLIIPAVQENNINNNNNFNGLPEVDFQAANNLQQDQAAAPLVFNIQLRPYYILMYSVMVFLIVFSYLFVSYFIPTIVGYQLISLYSLIIGTLFRGLVYLTHLTKLNVGYTALLEKFPQLQTYNSWVYQNIVDTLFYYYKGYRDNTLKDSVLIRGLPASVTYLTAICILCNVPEILCRGYGRTRGMPGKTRRLVFQLLFAIKCTFKVFTLFFIELVGFPILAGTMLDLVLFSPILGKQGEWLSIPRGDVLWFQEEIIYWIIGTLYMYWFAKYVGMIRQHIIRPGVLFFIRSPDDPNIKILHDSLIHPMRIQLSRLCLSMFIYAVFILVGFGFHTRFLFPVLLNSKLLKSPETRYSGTVLNNLSILVIFYFAKRIIEANPNVTIIVREYWRKIFEVSSRKLRLSSFILGIDQPTERGHIHYRNFFYKYIQPRKAEWSNPDLYSNPKTLSQAKELFRSNPNIHAYFIPDGVLMRVPSSDIVSRNYVQTMFVPVTKDDKLIKSIDLERIKERNRKNAGEFGYLDQQNTDFDDYFICYMPPNFRSRYILLITLMWFFASTLILCTAISAQYLFNTTIAVTILPILKMFRFDEKYTELKGFVLLSYKQMNVQYVCLGAIMLSFLVDFYQEHQLSRYIFREKVASEEEEENDNSDDENDNAEPQEGGQEQAQAQARPAAAAADVGRIERPDLENLIFENWLSKFLIQFMLFFVLSMLKMVCFSAFVGSIFYISFKYLRLVTCGVPMDVNATSLLYERNYYYDMILNFYVSIDFLNLSWKFLSNIREAEDRTCFGLVNNQWNKLILPELLLIKNTLFVPSLIFVLFFLENLIRHMPTGDFAGRSFRDMVSNRLSTENDNIPWTVEEHVLFGSISLYALIYAVYTLSRAIHRWVVTSVENVKESVYAKGRSLTNYSSTDTITV